MQLLPNARLLIVAPHPDDESIGCGGLLALFGEQCDVLLLTDGRRGKSLQRKNVSDSEIIGVRLAEIENALSIAGVNRFYHLDIPDSQLAKYKSKVYAFDYSPYQYIFVPNSHESHPDHLSACRFIKSVRFWGKTKAKIYEYEVWTPLHSIDWLLDISDVETRKQKMIEQHISQLECMDYLEAGMGLSHYRGIGCRTSAAEAFYRSPASLLDKIKRILSCIKYGIKKHYRKEKEL